jgi:hypothetical protein
MRTGKRPTKTLALPGDEVTVLDLLIREAQRRDEYLTTAERIAYVSGRQCAELKRKWARHGGTWRCNRRRRCEWCTWLDLL